MSFLTPQPLITRLPCAQAVKRQLERERDMEGIDTSNIIAEEGRRPRRAAAAVNFKWVRAGGRLGGGPGRGGTADALGCISALVPGPMRGRGLTAERHCNKNGQGDGPMD